MASREFLQLSHVYKDNVHLGGWYLSEKLDGMRAWYDGGVSRGLPASQIPWANVEKDARLKVQPIATGLWSRYGKVIHAPDWWLDLLPHASLDGELWCGRGQYQKLRDIAGHHSGDEGWDDITYLAFDMPNPKTILGEGRINNTNFRKDFDSTFYPYWFGLSTRVVPPDFCGEFSSFESRVGAMTTRLRASSHFQVHTQLKLPLNLEQAKKHVAENLDAILAQGGEGLILRDPTSFYETRRTKMSLKYKPFLDDEATVLGYIWGRETDKGSKLLGLMGAMVVMWKGVAFEISGFTDVEREMLYGQRLSGTDSPESKEFAGKKCFAGWQNPKFPIGSRITFRYRELTDIGIPKEARFLRKADD